MRVLLLGDRGFTGQSFQHEASGDSSIELFLGSQSGLRLQSPESISKAFEDIRPAVVLNLAALSSVVGQNHDEMMRINAMAVHQLLEIAKKFKVVRFIHASSSQIYGDTGHIEASEDALPRPNTFYGVTKLTSESLCRLYQNDMEIIISRPFSCIGSGQKPQFLLPKLIRGFRERQERLELGDVSISKDFVDIRDVARFYRMALTAKLRSSFEVFNVCSGKASSISQVISHLEELTGHHPTILRNPDFIRKFDIPYQVGNPAKTREALGWSAVRDLRSTLNEMLKD